MTERPILFSAPMVRALLAGTKTQTRRLVKLRGAEALQDRMCLGQWPWSPEADDWLDCPYGERGDRLWVKETWRSTQSLDKLSPSDIGKGALNAGYSKPWAPIRYEADGASDNWEDSFGPDAGKTRVSIHMPRWASRLTLEVTGVRVERVQDINDADAMAEGVDLKSEAWPDTPSAIPISLKPRFAFELLWKSINGADSWAANPWVWVVEFRRVTP